MGKSTDIVLWLPICIDRLVRLCRKLVEVH